MRKYLLGGAAVAAMVTMSPAISQVAQPAPAPNVMIHHAPMAAKVHSRAEVGAHVRTMFERLDANRDGYVTKAEAQAAKADRLAKRIERRGAAGSPDRPMMDRGAMFDRIDTNRDGSISRAEFEAAPTRHERRIVMRREGEAGGKPGTNPGSWNGAMGLMQGPMGLHGRMFEMADANNDGRVSLQEATDAAVRRFDMADLNKDGRLTSEERMQARSQMMRTFARDKPPRSF